MRTQDRSIATSQEDSTQTQATVSLPEVEPASLPLAFPNTPGNAPLPDYAAAYPSTTEHILWPAQTQTFPPCSSSAQPLLRYSNKRDPSMSDPSSVIVPRKVAPGVIAAIVLACLIILLGIILLFTRPWRRYQTGLGEILEKPRTTMAKLKRTRIPSQEPPPKEPAVPQFILPVFSTHASRARPLSPRPVMRTPTTTSDFTMTTPSVLFTSYIDTEGGSDSTYYPAAHFSDIYRARRMRSSQMVSFSDRSHDSWVQFPRLPELAVVPERI
ncbi:hypothetical protein BDW22DRAFT_1433366 [Trametopsis cervina]|nr:hypothetical protein BDW22DRAFT_1433366 [Trametopsis cervina]